MKTLFAVLLFAVVSPVAWAQDEPESDGLEDLDKAVLVELVRRQQQAIERLEQRIAELERGDGEPATDNEQEPDARRQRHLDIGRVLDRLPRELTPPEGEDFSLWAEGVESWLQEEMIGDAIRLELLVRRAGEQPRRGEVPVFCSSLGVQSDAARGEVAGNAIELSIGTVIITDRRDVAMFLEGEDGTYLIECTIAGLTLEQDARTSPWTIVIRAETIDLVRKIDPRRPPRDESDRERGRRERGSER